MNWRTWNDPTGRPLLLLHGFLGEALDWEPVARLLPFYCIAPDLPGHGTSPWGPDTTFQSTVNAIAREVTSHVSGPMPVVGYSMGGRIGLQLVASFPEQFSAIILESASLGIDDPVERRARAMFDRQIATKILHTEPRVFLKEWCSMPMFGRLNQHPDFEELIERRSRYNSEAMARAVETFSVANQESMWSRVKELPIAGFITGELDTKYVGTATRLATETTVPVSILPGLGHNCHFEDDRAVAAHLLAWLG